MEVKLQTGRKYLQNTYLIKDCYSKYPKNSKLNNKEITQILKNVQKTFNRHQTRYTDGKSAYKKMFHIVCHQGNENLKNEKNGKGVLGYTHIDKRARKTKV